MPQSCVMKFRVTCQQLGISAAVPMSIAQILRQAKARGLAPAVHPDRRAVYVTVKGAAYTLNLLPVEG